MIISLVDAGFAVWAGVATGYAFYYRGYSKWLSDRLAGACLLCKDIAEGKVVLEKLGEGFVVREGNNNGLSE